MKAKYLEIPPRGNYLEKGKSFSQESSSNRAENLVVKASDHFKERCWQRGLIPAEILKILLKIQIDKQRKNIVICTPYYLMRENLNSKIRKYLVVITKGSILKTAYWANDTYNLQGSAENVKIIILK
jgi:hypothetical protein